MMKKAFLATTMFALVAPLTLSGALAQQDDVAASELNAQQLAEFRAETDPAYVSEGDTSYDGDLGAQPDADIEGRDLEDAGAAADEVVDETADEADEASDEVEDTVDNASDDAPDEVDDATDDVEDTTDDADAWTDDPTNNADDAEDNRDNWIREPSEPSGDVARPLGGPLDPTDSPAEEIRDATDPVADETLVDPNR